MVLLGGVEILQRKLLDGKGLSRGGLRSAVNLVDDRKVRSVGIINAGTVLRTFVFALPVQAEGVDGLEVQVQKQFQAHGLRVVLDTDGLGKARIARLDLLV